MILALVVASILALASPDPDARSAERRVAVVLPEGWTIPELERWASFARRQGVVVRVGEPPASNGAWEVVRLAAPPVRVDFRRRLARFPVHVGSAGFSFDGRTYRDAGDAIALAHPDSPRETLVLGNSREAAARMLRRTFRSGGEGGGGRFRAVSGELTKEGRFRAGPRGPLQIDRASERDRIAGRERFFASLATASRGTAVWRFPEGERGAFERWSPVLERFRATSPAPAPVTVWLYPDPATKAFYTGSSRPADLSWERGGGRVDVDASAPERPDLVSPVLAAAAAGGADRRLRERPTLLLAAGARSHGLWWGRDVPSFASFLEAVGCHPSVAEVLGPERDDRSPVALVGAAAAWLDAGFRGDGEAAVRRAFAASDAELSVTLDRWRAASLDRKDVPPRRRALPAAFLRGVSYAMSNSVEGSYASPQSLETLRRLSRMSVNSVSVIPYAFSETPTASELRFVHRSPRGETDESTVRAVSDARSLGMTAMVKPQIWLGGGAFVGTIAMRTPAEWKAWFDAYRRFAVHHAIVAEASGAALFCVGTELSGTEDREREWRATIAAVRRATGAPLLYASNWAAGAPRVRFWDALDAIGTDFYDPLSPDPEASDAALVEGVRRAVRPVARLAATTGRPVVFAEAGYPPARAAWTAPHDEDSPRPFSAEDAARSVRAVFTALEGEAWWRGVYWWKAFSDGRDAPPGDRSFNFLGRPAGEAIAEGFRRIGRNGGPAR